MRVAHHPILGDTEGGRDVTILFNGKSLDAREGEPVAAALLAAGIRVFRKTRKRGEGRGLFCAIGRCTDCMMVVDGVANTRACITPVRGGMEVKTQFGLGERDDLCGK